VQRLLRPAAYRRREIAMNVVEEGPGEVLHE
jgi:hypothetical protein